MTTLPTRAPAPRLVIEERSAAWLSVGYGFAPLALGSGANAAASPTLEQRLCLDTPTASGVASITRSCLGCHGKVANRRTAVGGSANAQVTFALALARLQDRIQNQTEVVSFRALSAQQVRDLAAYIADTPSVTPTALDFSATAVNTTILQQSIDLEHAVTAGSSLVIDGIAITGVNSARFALSADSCTAATLAPDASCRSCRTFAPHSTAGVAPTLTLTMHEAAANSTPFTRTVIVTGVVASA
jgi:cytochrome c553